MEARKCAKECIQLPHVLAYICSQHCFYGMLQTKGTAPVEADSKGQLFLETQTSFARQDAKFRLGRFRPIVVRQDRQ